MGARACKEKHKRPGKHVITAAGGHCRPPAHELHDTRQNGSHDLDTRYPHEAPSPNHPRAISEDQAKALRLIPFPVCGVRKLHRRQGPPHDDKQLQCKGCETRFRYAFLIQTQQ